MRGDAAHALRPAGLALGTMAADDSPLQQPRLDATGRLCALAFAIAATVALTCASAIRGLGDVSPYRHLTYARQLRLSGFALHGHPFLPLTRLGKSGVDLWLGFHYLLVPFTFLPRLWDARVAGACFAGALAALLAVMFKRLGQVRALPFALAPLAFSPIFLVRDHLARPSHLTVILIVANLCAGLGVIRARWGFLASFGHALLHASSPISPLFNGIGLLARRLAGEKVSAMPVLVSTLGLAVGWLVHPGRPYLLELLLIQNIGPLGLAGTKVLPHTGAELLPMAPAELLSEAWLGWLCVAASVLAGWKRERAGSRATRIASAFALVLTSLMALQATRFVDYTVPCQALFAATWWPRAAPPGARLLRLGELGALVAGFAMVVVGVLQGWESGNRFQDPPATFEDMAAAVRAQVPPGTLLFTDDIYMTAIAYAYLPEYDYVMAYDPRFLYSESPESFWRWHHVVVEGTDCEAEACPNAAAGADAVARAVESFGTEWVITSYPRGRLSMQEVMGTNPGRFELRHVSAGPVNGLYLWHLRSPNAPRSRLTDAHP